jgi:hypothetical protein
MRASATTLARNPSMTTVIAGVPPRRSYSDGAGAGAAAGVAAVGGVAAGVVAPPQAVSVSPGRG